MNNKYSLPKDGGLIEVSAPRDIIHRYEKIHTTVYENEYLGVQYVADTIVKAIRTYNEIHCSNEVYEESQPFVLGLTTGRTPLGLYRELVKRHEEGIVSFRNVAVFSLDEFYPIRSTEQQSRNFRIHEDFLNHIDILPENIHIPDGTISEDKVSEYCASYDHSVRKIDLMIGRFTTEDQRSQFHYEHLSAEPLHVVGGQHHPLRGATDLSLTELAHWPWILYPASTAVRTASA